MPRPMSAFWAVGRRREMQLHRRENANARMPAALAARDSSRNSCHSTAHAERREGGRERGEREEREREERER